MPKFMAEHRDFLLMLYNLNYVEGKDAPDTEFGENLLNKTKKDIKNDKRG